MRAIGHSAHYPPLVEEATGEHGRKYWCVRGGSEGNYYYRLFRRNLASASENILSAEENIVEILALEIQRLNAIIDTVLSEKK